MVFEKESLPYVLYVGQGVNALEGQFDKAYDQIKKSKFDFFCLPLYNENADRARSNQIDTKQVNIQSDLEIENYQTVLVRISPHLDLDHPDESKRKMHKFLFKQEIEYAQYLGVYGVILPLPKEDTYAFYLKTMTKY